ncbi:MAG: YafY family protein [Rhodospirillales bacterium]
MRRADRLFEIIQILRAARGPMTADALAAGLEISVRTLYRDVAALQAMRVPIEGAAGIGYVMRAGYDLPPLNFDSEELEAIVVGLSLLNRTGDRGLTQAAQRVTAKIEALNQDIGALRVSSWGVKEPEAVDLPTLRRVIREERKLAMVYVDRYGQETERTVLPLALAYLIEVVVLTAWCDLRQDFRHFRGDRIRSLTLLEERCIGQGATLRATWQQREDAK